jgi:hypothetical protein
MFEDVFEKLLSIEQLSIKDKYKETWSNLTLEGTTCSNSSYFKELFESFNVIACDNALSFFIDGTKYNSIDEFILDLSQTDNWRVNINKTAIVTSIKDYRINFFYSIDSLKKWIQDTNPTSSDYFANTGKYKVFVNGLENNFGGDNFVFCSNDTGLFSEENKYDQDSLVESLRIISNNDVIVCPKNHYLTFGEKNDITRSFYRNSIIVLAIALSNEYHEPSDTVVIKGCRRLPLKISSNSLDVNITKKYQDELFHAIQWVYETGEKSDLRLKLLLERVSLDINISESYPNGLCPIIQNALTQAKERYSFITYERKDKYDKELKELLNDTKKICDSYSSKIRGVLSNLLRDVLAAFIMIGITQLSKVNELQGLEKNNLIKYVFVAFGWYFIASALFQLIIDVIDVFHSYKELIYWKDLTKEYITKSEYSHHIKATVLKRLQGSAPIYFILILLYVGIGIGCLHLPQLLHLIIK